MVVIMESIHALIETHFGVIYAGVIAGKIIQNDTDYLVMQVSQDSGMQVLFPIDEIKLCITDNHDVLTKDTLMAMEVIKL